jgi:hypothetical protein
VNLYVGKTAVKFNIPEAEAVDRLKDLIREHGKWIEPAQQPAALENRFIIQRRRLIALRPDAGRSANPRKKAKNPTRKDFRRVFQFGEKCFSQVVIETSTLTIN